MIINIKNKQETEAFGQKLGLLCFEGMCITLNGDLGAGKTTLTKSIGKALGVKKTISSPTFTILKIYQGNLPLYHIDAYRLEENPYDLGFEEYMDDDGIMVIEWFDYMKDMISNDYLELKFKYIDDETREIEFIPHGSKYDDVLKELEVC